MGNQKTINEVSRIFNSYLKSRGHRKTPERYSVLQEVFNQSSHFNVESLYLKMKNENLSISRATIYNTIELLLDSNLIKRHQFGKNIAQYEKSFEQKQHDHLICLDCDKVFEFCDPRIHQIQTSTGKLFNFNISHHALNFYGRCQELINKEYCENKGEG